MAIFYAEKVWGGKVVAGIRQTGSDGAVEGGRVRVRGGGVLGKSAVLQSGKCCAFTGLAAFAASPGGIRCLPVSKLPASVGFLLVALLIVMQQFDCSC